MQKLIDIAHGILAAADAGLYGPGDRDDGKHSEIEELREYLANDDGTRHLFVLYTEAQPLAGIRHQVVAKDVDDAKTRLYRHYLKSGHNLPPSAWHLEFVTGLYGENIFGRGA